MSTAGLAKRERRGAGALFGGLRNTFGLIPQQIGWIKEQDRENGLELLRARTFTRMS